MAQALLLSSISLLSVRLSTVPSRYRPSWKAAVNGVDPSAARLVRSLLVEGGNQKKRLLHQAVYTDMNLAVNKPAYKTSRLSRCRALAHVRAEPVHKHQSAIYQPMKRQPNTHDWIHRNVCSRTFVRPFLRPILEVPIRSQ
jgi:hypothetical protein